MTATTRPKYLPIVTLLGVTLIIALLLSPVDAFSRQGVTFIDTELRAAPTSPRMIETKHPLGDPVGLAEFPTSFGKWNMTHEYEWDFLAELLDTDLLMSRDYRAPGLYLPVSLLIIESTNVSSFHPAPVCYKAQGFTIVENETATVEVPVPDDSWARAGWFGEGEARTFEGSLEAKRLLVERTTPDGSVRRELNLYFYIKQETASVADGVAWVRISMYVPATGDYTKHEAVLKEFMAEVVPQLFVPVEDESAANDTLGSALWRRVTDKP